MRCKLAGQRFKESAVIIMKCITDFYHEKGNNYLGKIDKCFKEIDKYLSITQEHIPTSLKIIFINMK